MRQIFYLLKIFDIFLCIVIIQKIFVDLKDCVAKKIEVWNTKVFRVLVERSVLH